MQVFSKIMSKLIAQKSSKRLQTHLQRVCF